jgi:carbonic anhydrase/acetyltransferase-like protein (isoleucine patch superfamily)
VVGSPGKIVRQVSDEEVKLITENAIHYQENWKVYKNNLRIKNGM